jgi:hypothetical protein
VNSEGKRTSVLVIALGASIVVLAIAIVGFGVRHLTRGREVAEADAAVDDAGPPGSDEQAPSQPVPAADLEAARDVSVAPSAPSPTVQEPTAPAPTVPANAVDEVEAMLAQAQRLAETDPAEARRVLEQLAQRFPRNERVLSALASSLDGTDDERARDAARRCLEVNPGSVRCNTVMFSTYLRAGDYDAGLPYIFDCIRADSSDPRCATALLESRIHRGELAEAQAVSERIREHDDGGLGAFAAASVAEATGHTADALRDYQSACSQGYDAGCARAAALNAAGH